MTKASAPETVFVYPHPDLLARVDGAHLPGVGTAGAEVPADLASEWIAAGLATTDTPDAPAPEE